MPHKIKSLSPASALYIAGLVGFFPSLRVVTAFASADTSVIALRKDRILEALLRMLPCMPSLVTANDAVDFDRVWESATPLQTEPHAAAFGRWWEPVFATLCNEAECLFAQRCAAVLLELCQTATVTLPKTAVG